MLRYTGVDGVLGLERKRGVGVMIPRCEATTVYWKVERMHVIPVNLESP